MPAEAKRIFKLKKGLAPTVLCICVVLALPTMAKEAGKLLGDESDGSLSAPVHLIGLVDPEGIGIMSEEEPLQPFSTKQTCGVCHSYDLISKGWHFNAVDSNVAPGRAGEPWLLTDAVTGTQIPVSYRDWRNTWRPSDVGLSSWAFTLNFGEQTPGGGAGEAESEVPEEIMRQFVSGQLEINCLICHNSHHGQDQSEYAFQVKLLQNMRWAAAAASEIASVSGAARSQPDTFDPLMSDKIKTTYREGIFDHKDRVLFDIVREVPKQRCYFCHSSKHIADGGSERWTTDPDVHLTAGLTCIDCHRHGLEHHIVRGYEGETADSNNPLVETTTCYGCHLGSKSAAGPVAGRLGAPKPKHLGIPVIHFEKLACTTCHSGPWPGEKAFRNKTSRAHRLGTRTVNKADEALPHILYPVMAKTEEGKIAPHKLIWPAFWGQLKDGQVTPIDFAVVQENVAPMLVDQEVPESGDWAGLSDEQIVEILNNLSSVVEDQSVPVYVGGGMIYQFSEAGELISTEHQTAEPYIWPLAHGVRPASQSLGVRGCGDCHSAKSGFFYGEVPIDSAMASNSASKTMVEFQGIDQTYLKLFNMSFIFRPVLKVVALGSSALLGFVMLLALIGRSTSTKVNNTY